MTRSDWLVGGDRGTLAAERIYDAATELIAHHGMEALDIDALAARVHCSRATIYRHAGGKAEIREAVLIRVAHRIITTVRESVDHLTGSDRIVTAISVALKEIRSDPLGRLMMSSVKAQEIRLFTDSPVVARFARDINGLTEDDPQAAQWIVRIVLALMYWPVDDAVVERQMVQRFVSPAFDSAAVTSGQP
ncbi:TetR/AcrR family transcriptional regulator [Mycolicibacterium tusciae]|jgi:AcrR family transcriptional regulator|uniref:TetR family transcriptional regulator n=1 Tax=Mycolicibacterium tusciae TaxID=75922 RepID=A0A1X0JQK5_9MYCO|nr:TetR/AcrR family transcriptional regulator [Mycolicibacterium tusciae]ORB65198.1 TetR family transcriptional regulator [Mycolicibacterium tusciae]